MSRLTKKIEDKVYYAKGKCDQTTLCAEMTVGEIRECMQKLADYEDMAENNKDESTDLNWEDAKEYLYTMKEEYEDIGTSGLFGLISIDALAIRFKNGERTQYLYDEIMEIG